MSCLCGMFQVLKNVNQPKEKWGPANVEDRGSRYQIPKLPPMEFELGDPEIIKTPQDTNHVTITDEKTETNGNAVGVDNNGYLNDEKF